MNSFYRINTQKTIVMEVTYHCNLKCVHCYIPNNNKKHSCFIPLSEATYVFDKMERAGFDRILFTGGEPFANPQFPDIYSAAWDRGFVISIFTNATLIKKSERELLVNKRPDLIRVSLFGGTSKSYQRVTGIDLFRIVLDNIYFLNRNNMNVQVKIPLLRQNGDDIKQIHQKLKDDGISNKIEVRIIPRFNGDSEALKYRYSPKEIIDMQLDDKEKSLELYKGIIKKQRNKVKNLKYCVEQCQPFIINPNVQLQLCYFIRDWKIDLHHFNLDEAITILSKTISSETLFQEKSSCNNCDKQYICPYCPGWARNELDMLNGKIPFLCQLVELYNSKYNGLLS